KFKFDLVFEYSKEYYGYPFETSLTTLKKLQSKIEVWFFFFFFTPPFLPREIVFLCIFFKGAKKKKKKKKEEEKRQGMQLFPSKKYPRPHNTKHFEKMEMNRSQEKLKEKIERIAKKKWKSTAKYCVARLFRGSLL
ncbi:hypothetical protein RFI_15465, partial [Reticulomyxa filosa]